MTRRPDLDGRLDSGVFRSHYYLKEELVRFCRTEGLRTSGSKTVLTERISHYLDTGEEPVSVPIARTHVRDGDITCGSLIEEGIVCSEKHRKFFEREIGKGFTFNVAFQRWLRANAGKSYADAVNAYHRILADKKGTRTEIGEQFEYNTYIRDFFADNTGMKLADAVECWNRKKRSPGHNRYERSDLIALNPSE